MYVDAQVHVAGRPFSAEGTLTYSYRLGGRHTTRPS
jgi:hypothetical protein